MSDYNYRSYADCQDVLIENEIIKPENCLEYSDILKFSKAEYVVVKNCEIWGGKEDCVDMNRYCRDICIKDTKLLPRGKYGVTIKGGSHNITLKDVTFYWHGTETDIDIGNWSDQSDEKTIRVRLVNVGSNDSKPVKVRVLWGDVPEVIGGNVVVRKVPTILVKAYRFLRKRHLAP